MLIFMANSMVFSDFDLLRTQISIVEGKDSSFRVLKGEYLGSVFELKRKTRAVDTEFHAKSKGNFGISIYRAHNYVLTIRK